MEALFASTSVIIRTDQQSLKYIHEQRLVEGIQHKLLVKLLAFNYKVEYNMGRENRVADALSRISHEPAVMALSQIVPAWIEQVSATYTADEHCVDLLIKLSVDAASTPPFTLKNGILRFKNSVYIGKTGQLKQQLLQDFHKSNFGGHSGERATLKRLQLIFYWPNMKEQVTSYIKSCPVCQKNKSENTPYPGLLAPLPVPDGAWTHISMDFIEGLPKAQGKDVILVVIDRFTKYSHFIALAHPYKAQDVVNLYFDHVFKLHGMPQVIVTDRDPIFTSSVWQRIFQELGSGTSSVLSLSSLN